MKKLLFLLTVNILFAVSCKKCIQCTVYDSNGNSLNDSLETCGNSSALDKARDAARDESLLLGGTYECTDPE
jgi:hypothetical protein